ncbi:MAG: signal peptidase I [Oscillospiraceae bacterium]|nr:signal peptidase I [Oscillospiraceae bacterium]
MSVIKVIDRIFYILIFIILIFTAGFFLGPKLFGYSSYEVKTASMSDVYPVGSLIYVKNVEPEQLQKDDIITFELNGLTVTHRITDIDFNNRVVSTKGDMNNTSDGITPFTAIKGKASDFCIPYLGHLSSVVSEPKNKKTAVIITVSIFIFLLTAQTIIKKNVKTR